MDALTLLFWIFAAVTVAAALRVVTARNPVHSALYLVLTFFSSACIWMLLRAEFLAITLVLVYVGAVMVLFLFVVMMLDLNIDEMRQGFWRHLPVALFVGTAIVFELGFVLVHLFGGVGAASAPPLPADYSNTQALGALLYTDYVYPFEVAAVVLLVAIIAAIALTLRRRKDTRTNDPSVAVHTRRADRVRLIKMPAVSRARGGDGAEAGAGSDAAAPQGGRS
ncbi:MAG: NADH-quinone oxidoreductase subunit J [Burkholderiaceae bacterium]